MPLVSMNPGSAARGEQDLRKKEKLPSEKTFKCIIRMQHLDNTTRKVPKEF